ncbi:hypothetical protein [Zavarzinella formosa]|uniref:hypothetical protein n=1 Tax=Zavarzinella formosa TaxID=360055 RepID=UPI0002E3830C|nr:hypothetical protein [Zavarzinella formosa]
MAVCVVLSAFTGCGQTDQTLAGDVSFDGQPIDDGVVLFVPTDGGGNNRQKVGGQIANGKYSIESGRGLASGKYRVEVTWMKKTGRKSSTGDGSQLQEDKTQVLPAKFNSQSTLTAEIPAPGNKLDFQLKSN